jgi:hypothetical protein
MRCESYTRTERRTEGGWAVFDCLFVEAPSNYGDAANTPAENTQANVETTSSLASDEAVTAAYANPSTTKAGPR